LDGTLTTHDQALQRAFAIAAGISGEYVFDGGA